MKIYILGTGNAQALNCYNTTVAFSINNEFLLVDGGGGNQILKIMEEQNIKLSQIHHIFVTHNHIDHLLGVIWVIRRIGEIIKKGQYEGTLTIHSHEEVINTLRSFSLVSLDKKVTSQFGTTILFSTMCDGDSFYFQNSKVTSFDILSTKMKQFGFLLEGEGKKILYSGDEPLNEKNYKKAENVDYMTHEAFCLYEERDIFKPYEKHHSTAKDAAELAEKLGVKNLILYHTEDKNIKNRKALYTREAQSVYSGTVFVPDDGEIIIL